MLKQKAIEVQYVPARLLTIETGSQRTPGTSQDTNDKEKILHVTGTAEVRLEPRTLPGTMQFFKKTHLDRHPQVNNKIGVPINVSLRRVRVTAIAVKKQ
jgi:hypothetical protein